MVLLSYSSVSMLVCCARTTSSNLARSSALISYTRCARSVSSTSLTMAAKKGKAVEETIYFGRPSNHLKIGIVGLPNVGKSSTFNILTKLSVPAENYPFCTIDPNNARVEVPDARFDWLVDNYKPASAVRAQLSVIDIAGLVKGASNNEGMGNQFLSHIRAVDGIFHVVRVFEDAEVVHDEGHVEPCRDLSIIMDELKFKDIEILEKQIAHTEKLARADKTKKAEVEVMQKVLKLIQDGGNVRKEHWKINEIDVINGLQLFCTKPRVFLVNMSKEDYLKKKNKWGAKLKKWVDENGGDPVIPYSVALEQELLDSNYTSPEGAKSVMPKIIKTGYKTLNLIHYFTAGADEVKCWTIRAGTKAPQAAGVIHTDFEKGFIKAEVMKYDDYKEHGSEAAMKSAGKYRTEGKNYEVQDGDIIFFKFNAGGGLTKKKK